MTDRLFPLTTFSSSITVAAGLGVSFDAIAEAAGLPPGVLGDPQAMVTARQFHELAAALGRRLLGGADGFCLDIATYVRLDMVEVLGPLFATCTDVRQYFHDAIRFLPLIDPCIDACVEVDGEEVRFVVTPLPEQGADERFLHAEACFAGGHRLVRDLFKRRDMAPLRIEMQHDGSAWIARYRHHFGPSVAVAFAQPRNLIAFPQAWLDVANPGSSPRVHAQMERIALARLAAIPKLESVSARVLRFLGEESGRRVLGLADVAAHLGITSRTLQRRLVAENTTFQVLRDSVRHREACRLLCEPGSDVATIAATLGFSEPATFQRAFKGWSGMSPGEYRRRGGERTNNAG